VLVNCNWPSLAPTWHRLRLSCSLRETWGMQLMLHTTIAKDKEKSMVMSIACFSRRVLGYLMKTINFDDSIPFADKPARLCCSVSVPTSSSNYGQPSTIRIAPPYSKYSGLSEQQSGHCIISNYHCVDPVVSNRRASNCCRNATSSLNCARTASNLKVPSPLADFGLWAKR
jgi:hypothetical protein